MSYCVNCGVELEQAQKACPLCLTKVVNPAAADAKPLPTAFAQTRDEQKKINRGFWIKFNAILAAVPIAISLLSNLLYDKRLTWSLIVIAGVFILWAVCTAPFLFRRFSYAKMLLADFTGIALGLGLIQYVLPQQHQWYWYFALPIALFCLLFWLATIALIKKKVLKGLRIAAAFFVFVTLLAILLEALLDLYLNGAADLFWCWFVAAPCLSIAALFILLDANEQVRQELAKRLHF